MIKGLIKENTMRPVILDLLKTQSPLHLSAIHAQLEAVLGKELIRKSVSTALSKMVTEGTLRRAGSAVYAKPNQPKETAP